MPKQTLRKLYLVRITKPGHIFGTSLGSRFVTRRRAARIARWLHRRGVDASISPGMVYVTAGQCI